MTKNYEELTIKDHFMFGKISSNPKNRKLLLDSLLLIDLHEKTGDVEKNIQVYRDSKFARLDLISEDELNRIYNAEMQNKSNDKSRQEELPNRSRFYQSIIDSAFFDSGKNFLDLPNYNDNAHKIFFNTTADLSNLPQSQQNMLKYINDGIVNDAITLELDEEVKEARLKEEWRAEYMLTLVHDYDVYNEGYDAGVEAGKKAYQDTINDLSAENKSLTTEIEELKRQLKKFTNAN